MPDVVLSDLMSFFTRLAADREWQRSKTWFSNLTFARKVRAVPAWLEPDERFADPG